MITKIPSALTFIIFICLSAFPVQGLATPTCPTGDFKVAEAPYCPETLSAEGELLPESYPAMAVTVSDDTGGTGYVIQVARAVFNAQPRPLPLIFVNSRPERFEELLRKVQSDKAWTPQMIDRIRHVKAIAEDDFGVDSFTDNWQQDYLKGFFDPRTGRPLARVQPKYDQLGNLKEVLQDELASCGIRSGSPLPVPVKRNGYSGGNYDAGPPGFCLLGKSDLPADEWKRFGQHLCPGKEILAAPSQFTGSAHTDEIFKVLPLPSGGKCDYALAFASPRRAMELLNENPSGPMFDFAAMTESELERQLHRIPGIAAVCGTNQMRESLKANPYTPFKDQSFTSEGLERIMAEQSSYVPGSAYTCSKLTNATFRNIVMTDLSLREINQLAQAEIDRFRDLVLKRLKAKMPECKPKVLEFPALLSGGVIVEKNGTHRLPLFKEGGAVSLFPNPTNGHLLGRTYLMPEPFQADFKSDLKRQLSEVGLKTDFINTLKSHALLGNLHCTSQVLRYCRPLPKR